MALIAIIKKEFLSLTYFFAFYFIVVCLILKAQPIPNTRDILSIIIVFVSMCSISLINHYFPLLSKNIKIVILGIIYLILLVIIHYIYSIELSWKSIISSFLQLFFIIAGRYMLWHEINKENKNDPEIDKIVDYYMNERKDK